MPRSVAPPSRVTWRRLALEWLLPALFAGLAVAGSVRHFSPTPYWDMWDGQVRFFLAVGRGDVAAWWALHNEHRIVLSRILFWIDLAWLRHGTTFFLLGCNLALAALTAAILALFVRALDLPRRQPAASRALAALFVVFALSWVQSENLTWGFQSQMFLAQLVPLSAFYLLARGLRRAGEVDPDARRGHDVAAAALLGVASALTMANGVLAAPLLLVVGLLTRRLRRREAALLLVGCAIVAWLAIAGAPAAPAGAPLATWIERPRAAAGFVLRYLGSPAFHAGAGTWGAIVTGALVAIGSLGFAVRVWGRRRPDPLEAALVGMLVYGLATAAATAAGRLYLGPEAALASRYTTAVLVLWSCLAVLVVARLPAGRRRTAAAVPAICLAIAIGLLPAQLHALRVDHDRLAGRGVAALAIALGVRDPEALGLVYPDVDVVLAIGREAVPQHLTAFALPEIAEASADGTIPARLAGRARCEGQLGPPIGIPGEPRFVKVRGWIRGPRPGSTARAARIVDVDGRAVGHVLAGFRRGDVPAAGASAGRVVVEAAGEGAAFFVGYLRADAVDRVFALVSEDADCAFRVARSPAG